MTKPPARKQRGSTKSGPQRKRSKLSFEGRFALPRLVWGHCGRERVATHKRQPSARPAGGTMLASSRKPCDAANPMRRARSPALHCGRKRAATHKHQPSARPVGGTMLASSRKPCNAANPMRRARSPALHCGRERVATHKHQPSASPANPAISQTLGGGRERPPYIAAGSGRQRINASLPPGPYSEGRRSTTVIRPPCLPFPVWYPTVSAQRWDRLVRRGRVWYNSRKAARPVWLMPGRQPPLNAHGVMRGAKSSTLFCIPGRRGGPALAGPPTGEAG